jgi:hypothetical protein
MGMTPPTVPEAGPQPVERLVHIEEWCEQADGTHDQTCPDAFMDRYRKGDFVAGAEQSARAAIASFLMMREEGFSVTDSTSMAVEEANEGAMCFAGIGSCGRGWCKHA